MAALHKTASPSMRRRSKNPRRRSGRDDYDDDEVVEATHLGKTERTDWGTLGTRPEELPGGEGVGANIYDGISVYTTGRGAAPLGLSIIYGHYTLQNDGLKSKMDEAMVYDYDDEDREWKQAVEYEADSYLEASGYDNDDDNLIKQYYEDDEGKKVKKTDDEMQSEAEALAETAELQVRYEHTFPFEDRLYEEMDRRGVPPSVKERFLGFYIAPDDWGGASGDIDIPIMEEGEDEFMKMLDREYSGRVQSRDHLMPPELARAAYTIMEKQERESEDKVVNILVGALPVWAASKNIVDIREALTDNRWMRTIKQAIDSGVREMHNLDDLFQRKVHGQVDWASRAKAKEFAKAYLAIDDQIAWIKEHQSEIHPGIARILKGPMFRPYMGKKTSEKKKVVQMTVDMKKAKETARHNPEPSPTSEALRDYYFAFPNDPDIPINLLKAEGHGPEQLWQAAEELFINDEIDPSDLRAITGSIVTTPDPHVLVANPEPVDAPVKGTARERLTEALKHLEGVVIVAGRELSDEGGMYSPTDRYLAYLPRQGTVAAPAPTDEGSGPGPEMQEMFGKERAEHPDLPEEVIWQIVRDHMSAPRENPRHQPTGDAHVVATAFAQGKEKRGRLVHGYLRRDECMYRDTTWGRMAEEGGIVKTYYSAHEVMNTYLLWANPIAIMFKNDKGDDIISFGTCGWDTQLTKDRLNIIADRVAVERNGHRVLQQMQFYKKDNRIRCGIGNFTMVVPESPGYNDQVILDRDSIQRPFWVNLDADPDEELNRIMGQPIKPPDLETREVRETTLGRLQAKIDRIEDEIRGERERSKDWTSKSETIAGRLGREDEYRSLLEKRDKLFWRGNPSDEHMLVDEFDEEMRLNPSRIDQAMEQAAKDLFAKKDSWAPKDLPYVNVHKYRYRKSDGAQLLASRMAFHGRYVASVVADTQGSPILTFQTARLDNRRLTKLYGKIIEVGIKLGYEVLRGTRFVLTSGGHLVANYRGHYWTIQTDEPVPYDQRFNPAKYLWFDLGADPNHEAERILNIPARITIEEGETMEESPVMQIQAELDIIEGQIRDYRDRERDYTSSPIEVVKKLGLDAEYNRLTEARDQLFSRGNPCDGGARRW